ncbi:SPOR domain-containing protein [Marilutibacter penaei]|nr:SPOR domain-containing protein [Lysobacter penaei]
MPGWAWMVLGIVLTVLVVLVAPKYMKTGDGDGFFRPQPNPDARPAPSASADDELPAPAPTGTVQPAAPEQADEGYTFYEVLSGKEVPMTDAELAATQRAESEREAALARAQQDASGQETPTALPQPLDPDAAAPARPEPAPTVAADENPRTAAGIGDGSRYLLQAGAFQASGQAEELKAKIAMLGLGARVEAAESRGQTVYRVRMGPYGTAGDLADAKQKLENGGIKPLAIKVQ